MKKVKVWDNDDLKAHIVSRVFDFWVIEVLDCMKYTDADNGFASVNNTDFVDYIASAEEDVHTKVENLEIDFATTSDHFASEICLNEMNV
uniref:DUF1488 domain-containing protein n=1 Tax=Syphacia muris TaxID=451379 RepID=A0A0N5AJ18_9BILA